MRQIILIFFLSCPIISFAQALQDPTTKLQIHEGLNHLYDYNFQASSENFLQVKNKYPHNPAAYLLFAMQWEQQYFPLKDHPVQSKNYLAYLEKCYQLAQNAFDKNNQDLESAFFCSASLGFLAAYEADNQKFFAAVNYAKKAYAFMKIGLLNSDRQPEFLYSSGIYNYYRISYPDLHPIIKPFMFFFQDGDKKKGLMNLELATKKTLFVKNESLFYLGYIYNKYEGTPAKALPFNTLLIQKHPNNHWYLLQRAELLTLIGHYEEAEKYIQQLENIKSPYYTGAAWVFNGLKEEHKKKNWVSAENHYLKSLQFPFEERFTKDIRGLAYLGLARIAQKKGDISKMKHYRKLAKEVVEYKNSLEELD
jgi:hypothetical protein